MEREISPTGWRAAIVLILLAVALIGWRWLNPAPPQGVPVPGAGPSPLKAYMDRK